MQANLAKYEQLRIKSESQGLTSMVKKAVKRMAYDCKYLLLLFDRAIHFIFSIYLYLRHENFDEVARYERHVDTSSPKDECYRNTTSYE